MTSLEIEILTKIYSREDLKNLGLRNKDGKIPLDLAKREDFNRWVQLLNSSARSKWKMVYYLCKFVKRDENPNNDARRDSLADVSIITKGTWI